MALCDSDFIIKNTSRYNCKSLFAYVAKDSVVHVPDGVVAIGSYAFGDKDNPNDTITKIILPDSVEKIENHAFAFCTELKEIVWSENENLSLGRNPFTGCRSLEKISIPKNVTKLEEFEIPVSLKEIEVHSDIIRIPYGCFIYEGSDSLKSAVNSETVRVLCKNPDYKLIDGFLVNVKHKVALFYADKNKRTVHVPDGVEIIAEECFDELRFFNSVSLAAEMEICGRHCVSIEKVTLPASVKKIRTLAFTCCEKLKSITYEGNTSDLEIAELAFEDCEKMDGRKVMVICRDTPKEKLFAGKKITGQYARIYQIDSMLRKGTCPVVRKLAEKFSVSTSTIERTFDDILFYSGTDCVNRTDLIKYDRQKKTHYYTRDFELKIADESLWRN